MTSGIQEFLGEQLFDLKQWFPNWGDEPPGGG